VPGGHDKCVPKWRITLTFAQFRAVPGTVCKSPTTVFPGSNPGPATKTAGQARRESRACRPAGQVFSTVGAGCAGRAPGLGITQVGR
jgi:hypothetical protein